MLESVIDSAKVSWNQPSESAISPNSDEGSRIEQRQRAALGRELVNSHSPAPQDEQPVAALLGREKDLPGWIFGPADRTLDPRALLGLEVAEEIFIGEGVDRQSGSWGVGSVPSHSSKFQVTSYDAWLSMFNSDFAVVQFCHSCHSQLKQMPVIIMRDQLPFLAAERIDVPPMGDRGVLLWNALRVRACGPSPSIYRNETSIVPPCATTTIV